MSVDIALYVEVSVERLSPEQWSRIDSLDQTHRFVPLPTRHIRHPRATPHANADTGALHSPARGATRPR
jgi:hypothetical protein